MVRRYGQGDRLYVQAQQIWIILSAHAVLRGEESLNGLRKGVLTYGDLAELMGKPRRAGYTLGRQLGIVGHYCLDCGLPPLNVIVVNEKREKPGFGVVWTPGSSVKKDQRKVLKYPWFELRPQRSRRSRRFTTETTSARTERSGVLIDRFHNGGRQERALIPGVLRCSLATGGPPLGADAEIRIGNDRTDGAGSRGAVPSVAGWVGLVMDARGRATVRRRRTCGPRPAPGCAAHARDRTASAGSASFRGCRRTPRTAGSPSPARCRGGH